MGQLVTMGAMLKCSMGVAPSSLMVIPKGPPTLAPMLAATIMDNLPMANILPFGMCQSPANPMVIAATAAALGVLTPMPCIPVTPAPWVVGAPTVLIGNFPALNNSAKCMCIWGGMIQIVNPGQVKVQVP